MNVNLYRNRCFVLCAAAVWLLYSVSVAQDGWPRTISVPEGEVTIYQPQLESFEDNFITGRAAVAVIS